MVALRAASDFLRGLYPHRKGWASGNLWYKKSAYMSFSGKWITYILCIFSHQIFKRSQYPKKVHCPGELLGWLVLLGIRFCFALTSVQSLSCVRLFATPWIAARQASLSITNSRSSPKLMSMESVMPSSHLILCRPLLLPSIFPSIRVFSNESALHIRWPKYWSFSFKISPSNENPGLISFSMDRLDLLAVQGTLKSLLQHGTVQMHKFFGTQLY